MHESHVEPEFQLVLISPGPQRARVIVMMRQLLNVTPAEARRLVDQGEVVVAAGLTHYAVGRLKAEFETLGATVTVRTAD